jgi:hypothetical protein
VASATEASDAPGGGRGGPRFRVFDRIANRTDRDREAVAAEFASKRRYVEYLVRDGVDDPDALFEFLADLRTDEAATVERAARTMDRDGDDERGDSAERGRP